MTNISIAIPTWECYGKGSEFLDDLLRTIEIQKGHYSYEVCISDHSKDDEVLNKVKEFEGRLQIHYQRNENDRGNGPANTNKAIEMCSGDMIKVMFQDDFFYDDEALEKICNSLYNSDKVWLLNGCNHTADHGNSFYWDLCPRFNDKLLDGVNTLSSPSVLTFKKEVKNRFDKNLVHFMDIDFFYGMKEKYGDPIFYDDVLITNRFPSDYSVSNNTPKDFKKESKYCKEKYGVK
jgi:glycosyltransferase involved in cell wall biosynthesis